MLHNAKNCGVEVLLESSKGFSLLAYILFLKHRYRKRESAMNSKFGAKNLKI